MSMRLLERVYRGRCGILLSWFAQVYARFTQPKMIYGLWDPKTKEFRKNTRYGSNVLFVNKENLSIGDYVYINPYTIIDASNGITIEDGVQIGAWVGIFTHGSENSIRLLGKNYINIPFYERKGYTKAPVHIGKYTFIGAGVIILPGVSIGKGCIISAGTVVNRDVPDFSILSGNPATIVRSTLEIDQYFFKETDYSATYYDKEALEKVKKLIKSKNS